MSPSHAKRGAKRYSYYVCSRAGRHGAKACPKSRVAAGELEAVVVEQIRSVARVPRVLLAAVEADAVERADGIESIERELSAVRDGRAQHIRERGRLIDAVGDGRSSDGILERVEELDGQVRRADERLQALERDLHAAKAGVTDPEALADALRQFAGVWDALTLEERRRALDLLLTEVAYDGRSGSIELVLREFPATGAEEAA